MAVVVAGLLLYADHNDHRITARLDGFQEVPPISTPGEGEFRAELNAAGTQISYTLEYSGLQGTPQAAHIHFGPRTANGGVIAFLCGGAGKPLCPASGSVSGTIIAADIIGPAEQGIGMGEFDEALRAMRAGMTYVNVHTNPSSAGGEIRGQVRVRGNIGDGDDDDDDDDDDEQKGKGKAKGLTKDDH
jgi:hypothetical protein